MKISSVFLYSLKISKPLYCPLSISQACILLSSLPHNIYRPETETAQLVKPPLPVVYLNTSWSDLKSKSRAVLSSEAVPKENPLGWNYNDRFKTWKFKENITIINHAWGKSKLSSTFKGIHGGNKLVCTSLTVYIIENTIIM